MAFFQHPITFAVCMTLTLVPLFAFCLLPFKPILPKKTLIGLWIASAALLLANGVLLSILYAGAISQDTAILIFKLDICGLYLVWLIPFLLFMRKALRETMFVYGVVGIFALLMLSVALFILHQLPEIHGPVRLELLCGMLLLIAAATYPFIRGTLRSTVTPFLNEQRSAYWRNIWIIPNAMLIAMICAVPMTEFLSTVPYLVSRLLIGLATVLLCRSIAYDYVLMTHRANLESQITAQKENYKAMRDKLDNDRRMRHDFLHQLSAITAMAENGETEALKDYCRRLMDTARGDAIPYTGNAAVDGVLYRYVRRAKQAGVPFEIRGHFKAHASAEIDVCVALGNALENALTATAALPADKRFIEAELLLEGALLTVTVKNSFDGVVLKENDTILSRKRDREPGYGLDSIRTVCKAHGGTVSIHHNSHTFAVMMLMNMDD